MLGIQVSVSRLFSLGEIQDVFRRVDREASFLDCGQLWDEYLENLNISEDGEIEREPFSFVCSKPLYFIQKVDRGTGREETVYVGMTARQTNADRLFGHKKLTQILFDWYDDRAVQIAIRFGAIEIYVGLGEWLPYEHFRPEDDGETVSVIQKAETAFIRWLSPPYNDMSSTKIDEQIYLRITEPLWGAEEVEFTPIGCGLEINVPPRHSLRVRNDLFDEGLDLEAHREYLQLLGVYEEVAAWKSNRET